MSKFASLNFSKQANKVIACLLAVLIVMSTVIISSAVFVSAEADESDFTVTQDIYNTYDVNDEGEVESKVGKLDKSLLSGKNAFYYNGTSFVDGSANANFAKLTDGKICNTSSSDWFNVNFYKAYNYEHEGTPYSGSASRMYYDLGTNYSVNQVILVDASNNAGSNLTLPSFKLYLSQTASEHILFDVDSLSTSYSITANTTTPGDYKAIVYKINFKNPVDARYIGFEFPENSCAKGVNSVVIYEVAAFSENIEMNNTYYKLTTDKKLNITYLGGSVTSGHGASDPETKSWRGLTTQWFKDNYPNATISAKNGAVGSTGSQMAAYHYGLINQHKTDLLFVDSAINDFYSYNNKINNKGNPQSVDAYNNTLRNLESLIRNARKANPNIEIVFVLTFDHWRVSDDSNPSLKAMVDLAKKYKLPCIDLRVPLKARADADGLAWHSDGLKPYRTEDDTDAYEQLYLKGDGVHPNDAGYKIFGDYVAKILKGYMDSAKKNAPSVLDTYTNPTDSISANLINNPTVVTADKITTSTGWTRGTKNFSYLNSNYANVYENKGVITTSTPNSTLSYSFVGTEFGLFAAVGPDCGQIYVEVDGVPYKQGTNGDFGDGVIDLYQGNNDHKTIVIAPGLENKEHTVTIKSLAGTGGNRVEIGSFLVDKAEVPEYTVTSTTGSINDEIPTALNLINGKTISENYSSAFAHTTDGKNAEKGAGSTSWPYKLTYNLGGEKEIGEIQVISSTGGNRLGAFEIYVSDNANDLYDAKNLKAAVVGEVVPFVKDGTTVDIIQFEEKIKGSYFGVKLTKCNPTSITGPSYVNEIIVKTEKTAAPLADYTVTTAEGSANDTLPSSQNIINGKSITNTSIASAFAHVTDGKNSGKGAGGSGWPYKLTYALGKDFDISEVQVISGTNTNRLGGFEIYISDKEDDLYNAENLKATVIGETVAWKTGATTIDTVAFKEDYATGSFIGIKLTKCHPGSVTGASYIHEIIVKGAEVIVPVKDWSVNTTYGTTNDPINTQNLIYGINPQENGGTVVRWTDGVNKALEAGMTKLSFPLENEATINKVKVISQNGYGSKTSRPKAYDIYIADSYADLYKAENKVATFSTDTTAKDYRTEIDTFEFTESYAKTGKYIGFHFTQPNVDAVSGKIYINEIEVYGEEVNKDWSVTTTYGNTNDPIDKTNLIYGINPDENGGTVVRWTDGVNKALEAGMTKLSFPLVNKATINKIKITSQNGYGSKTSRPKAYDIYIADSFADLYKPENKVATFSTNTTAKDYRTEIDTFEFAESYAKKGKYIGFHFTEPNVDAVSGKIYINEIEVFGKEDVAKYTVTTTTHKTNEYTIDKSSIIYGINPDENGGTVTRWTDGEKTCLPAGMTKLSFPLVEKATINKVRVISQNGYTSKASRVGAYDIYIADTYADLYKPENKVASFSSNSTATDYVATIDTFEFASKYAKEGKYIGFHITKTDNAGLNKIHINEIEVFGTGSGSGGGQGGEPQLGTRPTLPNVDKNFEYKEGASSVNGERDLYGNVVLKGEAHTSQYVALDYAYVSGMTPVVWAKAIKSTNSNASVTGYYVYINGATTQLYKRTSDGTDTLIGTCGNHDGYSGRIVRLELVTEKVGNATKITVSAYKSGTGKDADKMFLMTKNTIFDETAELQTPGYAGYSVKGVGKTADIKGFVYASSDGTADNLSYIQNPITASSSGIAGQKVILDPAKKYTLSARVSQTNTSLAIYYWAAPGKMEKAFASVGTISNVGGYRTVTYEFCLNDIIAENGLAAPYADLHAYNKMAEVFVGFVTDKANVISYSNLSLKENVSGREILTNQNLKMGLLGFAEVIENSKWAFEVGSFGNTTTRLGRLILKTNVSQTDYDAIFKMESGENTGIDYSKYDKLMLHINGTGGEYGKVGQFIELDIGSSYVYEVDFGYDPRNSATPIIFYHTVENGKITSNPATRIEPSSKLSKDGCRTKYIFTVPDKAYKNPETGKATIFVGVSTGKAEAKCYFYDFVLYKENDTAKTNLFLNPKFEDGFKHWIVNHNYVWSVLTPVSIKTYTQPGTGVELLPYDAAKFQLDDGTLVIPDIPEVDYNNYKGDFMIYIPETVTDTYGKFGQVLYFERDAKYNFTMSFKYIRQNSTKPVVLYYKDDPYASNDYIISKGYTNSKGEADRVKYLTAIRDSVSFDLIMDDANSTQTVEFKVPSDAWKNSEGKSPMFVGISSGEKGTKCYFANFRVFKEGSKENMLLNADFKQGFLNWICNYGYLIDPVKQEGIYWTNGFTIAQILPYDADIFVNDTNDGLWSDGDWFSIFGEDDKVVSTDGAEGGSDSENTKKVTVPGKINIPATIALYGGIAVILAAGVIIILLIKKKKKQQA